MLKSLINRMAVTSALALMLGSAAASALTAEQKVFKEIKTVNANGTTSVERVEADLVTPGETVIYALSYFNDGIESASDIVLTMPVPDVVIYQEGSAEREQTRTTYSADGGKSFALRHELTVTLADGGENSALAADITHIRWTRLTALTPGETGELSFSGELK